MSALVEQQPSIPAPKFLQSIARSEKWEQVFGRNVRQNKDLDQRSDSLETEPDLAAKCVSITLPTGFN